MSQDMMQQQNKPAFLQQVENQLHEEFSGGMEGGLALPMLSIRGKEFRFRFQGQEQSTRQREIEVIMVASRTAVSKRYFAESYTAGETATPTCASSDGIAPDSGTELQSDKCATCPHNAWGSKVTQSGKLGKACNDYKRLVVLPIMNGKLIEPPSILDVPATSLRMPKGYQGHDLFLREYLNQLSRNQVPPTGAVTKLGFTDAEYPQLCFEFSRFVDEDEFNKANGFRGTDDVESVLSGDNAGHEPKAEVKQAQPAPEPAPQPEAKPEADPAPKTQEHVQPEAKPEPAPEPQAAPEPAPQPEQAAQPAEQSDDVMSQVNDLLKGLE